jgi:hypothetical protein
LMSGHSCAQQKVDHQGCWERCAGSGSTSVADAIYLVL